MARRDASDLYGKEHVRKYRDPEAEVQVLADTFPARAREATPELPVIVLERT